MARRRRNTGSYIQWREKSPWLTQYPGVSDRPSMPSTVPGQPQPPDLQAPKDKPPAPPYDPMLDAYRASANRNAVAGQAWGTYQSGELDRDYGFTPEGAVDPNNPYSRAALLQRSYQDSVRGNTNSYAASGQLYSGALKNAQNRAFQNYDIGLDSLKRDLGRARAGVVKGQLDSYAGIGSSIDDATFSSLLKALG